MHDHVLPYHVDLYAHSNEWLVRMLMHLGRVREARLVAMEMIDLPRHPLYNALEPPEEIGSARERKERTATRRQEPTIRRRNDRSSLMVQAPFMAASG